MRTKMLPIMLAVLLTFGLMPAPAFGAFATIQGTPEAPTTLELGQTLSGQVSSVGNDQWYRFASADGTASYDLRVICAESSGSALVELVDDAGNIVGSFSTLLAQHRSYLLKASSSYKVKVSSIQEAHFSISVVDTPAPLAYDALGADRNDPYALAFGIPANSQFNSPCPDTSQSQWFSFTTGAARSVYALKLFVRTSDQQIVCTLYDKNGDVVTTFSTYDMHNEPLLLDANEAYLAKVSADYGNKASYPAYELTVIETPSKPRYAALGTDEANPYVLELGKTASSQFDEPSEGTHEQWFSFTTSPRLRPYAITATSKTKNRTVRWDLYESSGLRAASSATTTTQTYVCELARNAAYKIKVTSYYDSSVGYPSYQLNIAEIQPGSVPGLKVSAEKRALTVRHGVAQSATVYQIAYRKVGSGTWSYLTTATRKRKLSNLVGGAKYRVKVRSVYRLNDIDYHGSWSKAKTVKTKA